MARRVSIVAGSLLAATLFAACQVEPGKVTNFNVPEDVGDALEQLPRIAQVEVGDDGLPNFVRGDLGRPGRANDMVEMNQALAPALAKIAPIFRLQAGELEIRKVDVDNLGMTHVRYQQFRDGLEVVGGELVAHIDANGVLESVSASARGRVLVKTPSFTVEKAAPRALELAAQEGVRETKNDLAELVYVVSSRDQNLHIAWRTRVTGVQADGTPVDTDYFVDAHTGELTDAHPRIHTAKTRRVYSANHGTSLPGTLKRSEGGAAVNNDPDVNTAYDNTGLVWDCYKNKFARDASDATGTYLTAVVHYSSNYVNAFWDGARMVYGDGDGQTSISLAQSFDVTAHELTHAVTGLDSGLVYQNESGALNEGMSDIMAAYCEAIRDGGANANTWKIGEEVWTPGTAGDALRYMNDPIKDNQSYDYWPTRYTGSQDNGGVHLNSGIANLAFYLLSQGGTHPRGKTTQVVPSLGIDKAGQIFYRANSLYFTSSTNFAAARVATVKAATDLYGSEAACAVNAAWIAVGVNPAGNISCDGTTPPTDPPPTNDVVTLSNGVPVSGISASINTYKYFTITVPTGATNLVITTTGGSGDADVYVKAGTDKASTTSYQAKSEGSTNAETVTIATPTPGPYSIAVNAYAAISGVTITAKFDSGTTPPPAGDVLQSGVPVTGISGSTGSFKHYKFDVPAGTTKLTFKLTGPSGSSGDADLYVRFGAQPTTTQYDARPYLNGNNETVTIPSGSLTVKTGTYYVSLRGYTAYTNVTLTATRE